jgi:hypothetical protein
MMRPGSGKLGKTAGLSAALAGAIIMVVVPALLAIGCGTEQNQGKGSDDHPPKMVMVFLDRSSSTHDDREIFRTAMDHILAAVRPGDRLVMGPITEASSHDFAANIDIMLPSPFHERKTLTESPLIYTRDSAAYSDTLRKLQDSLTARVRSVLDTPSSARLTAIFETLKIAEQFFASEKRKKVLVFLSDMVEESAATDFSRQTIDEAFIAKEISRQKNLNLIPELPGVFVYVVGATAATPERTAAIERFWKRYFAETGATFRPGCYARVLHAFDE